MHISIDRVRSLIDRFPRPLLERYRLLPYAEEEGHMLLATDQPCVALTLDELTFRMGRGSFRLNRVPPSASFDRLLFAVVNELNLDDLAGEMEIDCDCRFELRCPLDWFELGKTHDPLARLCRVCDQTVYFATTESQRQALRERGHCVAFREVGRDPSAVVMGYVVDLTDE